MNNPKTIKEIKSVVKNLKNLFKKKTPGPDGFLPVNSNSRNKKFYCYTKYF